MPELYYNGSILTMDEACPRAQAVLVENGRILDRGSDRDLLARRPRDTVCIDLNGKTMLPGFLDGHSHFAGLATSLGQCDLSGAEDFGDIQRLMRDFIHDNRIAPGQWVVGTNYDNNFLKEKAHPDRAVLDEISKDHPMVIVHASSHMGVANSLGLEMQGLTGKTPDPAGGRYGRREGNLTGYMEENAFVAFRNAMPMPEIRDIMDQFSRAQQIYASYGITTIQEGMVTGALLPILQYAAAHHVLYLDLVGYLDLEHKQDLEPPEIGYHDHFRIGGYKIFLDGSPQGRTAWMLSPYENAPDGYRGYPVKTDDEVYDLILRALEDGCQLLAHCNGDAAAEQYITQFQKVLADHPQLPPSRPVMVHAQLVQKEQLARMATIPMTPSFFVAHTYHWGDIHLENFGFDRGSRISPAATAGRLGLPYTFHQDSPVLPPDVLGTIWCAAKRVTKTGVELDREERISVLDGLKAATVNAARQYGEEASKGTIEPGKLADLILLDRDPLAVSVEDVKDIRILATLKEGRLIYGAL